jgi:hypothetical protein
MDSTPPDPAALKQTITDNSSDNSNVMDNIQLLWRELRALNHAQLRLAALETQQAGYNLVIMIATGIMMAILLSVAWLGVLALALVMLSRYEILTDPALLILLAVGLNLLLILVLVGVMRSRSYYLRFPATLRSLKTMSAPQKTERM